MITSLPTKAQLDSWKQIWATNREHITPARKSGNQLIDYLNAMYELEEIFDGDVLDVISGNITHNPHSAEKLPDGHLPCPRAFHIKNHANGCALYSRRCDTELECNHILVGVDSESGCYHVEGSRLLWDELCAYQGVDNADLDNYVVTAQFLLAKEQIRQQIIGRTVSAKIDRTIGSRHPRHPDIIYPVNYGYVPGIIAPDSDEQDVYVLGVDYPISDFRGRIIAIIVRRDDVEDKWVAAPEYVTFTREYIARAVHFQEQYFDSLIIM